MPQRTPVLDYSQIRNYAERFTWLNPTTGQQETGYNPPSNAIDKHSVPFTVTFLTESGHAYRGRAICIGVNTAQHTRRLQFLDDALMQMPGYTDRQRRDLFQYIPRGEVRQVSDLLIIEIDGVRFSAS